MWTGYTDDKVSSVVEDLYGKLVVLSDAVGDIRMVF